MMLPGLVRLLLAPLGLENLRGHVVRGVLGRGQISVVDLGETEVGELDAHVFHSVRPSQKEKVFGFDVSVRDVEVVAVLDGLGYLRQNNARLAFCEVALFRDVLEKLPSFHQLHHQEDPLLVCRLAWKRYVVHVSVDDFNDMVAPAAQAMESGFLARLRTIDEDLEGVLLTRGLVPAEPDGAAHARAEGLEPVDFIVDLDGVGVEREVSSLSVSHSSSPPLGARRTKRVLRPYFGRTWLELN